MKETTEQFCPACGCVNGENAYEEEGVVYCCEGCAVDDECECGCCDEEEEEFK